MKEVRKRRTVTPRATEQNTHVARRRKRKKRSYALYYLLLLFFVLVSGITLSLTVFFNIETITVLGSELHESTAVIEASGVKQGDNLLRTDLSKTEARLLDAFGDIDDVTVTRKFPNALQIEVVDAVPTYHFADAVGYTVLSDGGRVLSKNIPLTAVNGGILLKGLEEQDLPLGSYISWSEDETFALVEQLDQAIAASGVTDITYLDISSPVNLIACYQDRIQILLGSPSELNYKLNFAKNILDNKLAESDDGVIDASKAGEVHFVPNKINPVSSEVTSDTATSSTESAATGQTVGSTNADSGATSSAQTD